MQRDKGRNVTYNRLFILGGVDTSESEFRTQFSQYGNVLDVRKVIKRDGKDKGL